MWLSHQCTYIARDETPCNLNEISCTFTFLTNYSIGGLAPAFYILSIEFDKTMNTTSGLLLWPALVLGLFNFFWVPLANYFGKRPIFVLSLLLFFVCNIWGAMAKGFESLLWSNIIAAFAGSSSEALGAAIVNVSSPLPGSRDSRSRDRRGMLVW